MATTAVDSTTAEPTSTPTEAATDIPLQLDSIPLVDLNLLSQSELYSLSLCSPSTFDPRRCDDVVIPKIDRSVFNESAGSRKQTYSRLRLAPPSAAAVSPSSMRRRTPHLRSTNHNLPPQYLDTDPERAESREIVALLKQLFGVDSNIGISDDNTEELVPIRVDYSDSVPQLANVVSTGQKRKRGRPRKNEIAIDLVENKVESQCDDEVVMVTDEVVMVTNEVMVYENVDDKDKDIVNRDGVEVDLVQLGLREDPFHEELTRRTEGMVSEEELLGFLRGLNGQWGSRRKKKRIVDASEFGNALPKGWRIMLSCKKKEGHVWLFCRRYISPNGRQFVSCKDVSAYLLSLHGIQVANQHVCAQNASSVDTSVKMAFANTADLVPDEKREEKPSCPTLPPAVGSTFCNSEVQVAFETGDLPAVQVGEILHCEKCNLTFNRQDDLLHHQLSSHRRKRSKNGESVTEGVIIKGGKFECQFCHKTFDERNRYNGHVGAHIKNQVKCSDEAGAADMEECAVPVSLVDISHGDPAVQTSTCSESNLATDIASKKVGDMLNSSSPQVIIDQQSGHLEELNDKLGRVDDATNVVVSKSISCLDTEAVLSIDESSIHFENSGDANVVKIAAYGIEESYNGQGRSGQTCSSFPLDKEPGCIDNNVTGNLVPQERAVSGSILNSSNENELSCDIDLEGGDFSHTKNALGLEGHKIVDSESIFGCCNRNDGQDNIDVIGVEQLFEFEDQTHKDVDNANDKLVSAPAGSNQKIGSESRMLTPSGDREEHRNNVAYNIFSTSAVVVDKLNKSYACGSKEGDSSAVSNKDILTSLPQGRSLGSSTFVPSWNKQVNIAENFKNEVSAGFIKGHEQPKGSESSFPSLSGFEGRCGVEQCTGMASIKKTQVGEANLVQNIRKTEFAFPFGSSNSRICMDSVTNNKHEGGFEFQPSFSSENGEVISIEDNLTNLHSCAVEESQKEPSDGVLPAQSSVPGKSNEAYNVNKIFCTQVDERKLGFMENSKNQEPCLSFDGQANSYAVEQNSAKSYGIHSGSRQTYAIQSNLKNIAHNSAENPKEGRAFEIDLRDSSFSDKAFDSENNFSSAYPGRVWELPKVDEVGNSGNKFMVGFGSSNPQPVEDVMSGSIWRTEEENLLQADLTDTSTPLLHSSNNFHTFDIISNKGDEGLFGDDNNYGNNTAFEGLTLGRTEPTEYSFMTTQSSNPLRGESKGFSYNTDTEQGFNSSFWLGRDALTGRNQVPTVCVWCRNEFYQEPIPSGAQAGAIGSMCPSCSSRISQQFNVL